jgi:CTP:molybdopterin cytidylyltransferase MocA
MRFPEIPLILPAAGKSSRLGVPKGLRLHHGRLWLDVQCESFHAAGGKLVVLVLGYSGDEYRKVIRFHKTGLTETVQIGGCEVQILNNPLPQFGPFSSLQGACRWILRREECRAAFFQPIDTPVPSPEVFFALLCSLRPGRWAAEPRWGQRGGHPVLLGREFMDQMMRVDVHDPQARLDRQMRRARERGVVAAVNVADVKVVMNLNDADAWRYYERFERREETNPPEFMPMDDAYSALIDQPVS